VKGKNEKIENMSDVLSGLKDILVANQASSLKLLEESERRAEKRQAETDARHEKRQADTDTRHEKQIVEVNGAIKSLAEAMQQLTISHTESKKDRERYEIQGAETKSDVKYLKKRVSEISELSALTAERQKNNTNSIDTGKDSAHKVITAVVVAYLVYLMGFKGG